MATAPRRGRRRAPDATSTSLTCGRTSRRGALIARLGIRVHPNENQRSSVQSRLRAVGWRGRGRCHLAYLATAITVAPERHVTDKRERNGGSLMPIVEYESGARFPGVIGRTAEESSPAWPTPVRAAEGAPNVLFIVLDDTGFGQLGCYGSPIATPNLDGIAGNGLRYNNMHTTPLRSPSRPCILTGRNHHAHGLSCNT